MERINDDGTPVILVTGGTSGIGLATAQLLAGQGNTVIAAGLNAGAAARQPHRPQQSRQSNTSQQSGRLVIASMDVTVPEQINEIIAALPRLDAIIHCAGFGIAGSAECTPIEAARRQFDVNYFGVLQVNTIAMPLLRKTAAYNRQRGKIIVIGSIAGRIGIPFQSHYSSTKAALERYVEALRLEGHHHGVTATIVEPGDLSTAFTKARIVAEPHRSPYSKELSRSVRQMEHDEQTGESPEIVAKAVVATLAKRNPPVRVVVGSSYKALMQVKRLLPDRTVEAIMRKLYM